MNLVVLDANLWVAAYDPEDPFHAESVEVFQAAVQRGLGLAGPSYVVLESVCALARRAGALSPHDWLAVDRNAAADDAEG